MESYTSLADYFYLQAEQVDFLADIPPYTSCYEPLLQQEQLYQQARDMQSEARNIRKRFQEIAAAGTLKPTTTMLRKGVLSVKNGKMMFSYDQLTKVAAMIMGKFPYFLFRPKADSKDYIILLFWATNSEDTDCEIQKNVEVIKQEVAGDGFQLRFINENLLSTLRQVLYITNNYPCLKFQTEDISYLSSECQAQLHTILDLVKPGSSKKRKLEE